MTVDPGPVENAGDGESRRDTPLARLIAAEIAAAGPMPLSRYFDRCMYDPEHGYYVRRAGVGSGGDFITAPEISQIFGELVGLWCAVVWQQMGSPHAFALVEWGPGRGTLIADALRATRIVPGFHEAVRLCLVETSAPFAAMQDEALAAVSAQSRVKLVARRSQHVSAVRVDHPDLARLPAILIGNEVLDTATPQQYVRHDDGWFARHVGLDAAGRLVWRDLPLAVAGGVGPVLSQRWPDARPGEVLTLADVGAVDQVGEGWPSFAGLFIDYGSDGASRGDSLQAVRGHAFEHPLTSPGEADLTTLVDFSDLARVLTRRGFTVDGPITQGEFLGRLGIVERASRLMSANPAQAATIEAGVARLMAPLGMGSRFKALGVRSQDLRPLPGFPTSAE